jgi:hypothetical protein
MEVGGMTIHLQTDVADTTVSGTEEVAKGSEVGATCPVYQQAELRP